MEIQETDKMTAWEELNGRPCKPSESLEETRAQPCALPEAMRLLGKNLTLCSPSGMSEADRIEWLKVAVETIGDIPQDLLEMACRKAKRVCDHPAKIVPFICKETEELVAFRKKQAANAKAQRENAANPRLTKQPEQEPDRKGLAADIGALARELERKVRMSETN